MHPSHCLLAPLAFLAALAAPYPATALLDPPIETGAAPGRWTMDLDAAKQFAAQKNLPLLLQFTASDWNFWCQRMDQTIFSSIPWDVWAAENLVLVWIDFPRDPTRVPPRYTARNAALAKQYNIHRYPAFILLAPDGITFLGRLGAIRNASPHDFIAALRHLLLQSSPNSIRHALPPEELPAFDAAYARWKQARAERDAFNETNRMTQITRKNNLDRARASGDLAAYAAAQEAMIDWHVQSHATAETLNRALAQAEEALDAFTRKINP